MFRTWAWRVRACNGDMSRGILVRVVVKTEFKQKNGCGGLLGVAEYEYGGKNGRRDWEEGWDGMGWYGMGSVLWSSGVNIWFLKVQNATDGIIKSVPLGDSSFLPTQHDIRQYLHNFANRTNNRV